VTPDPTVTAEAAPLTEVTSRASEEPTALTLSIDEEISEVTQTEAADEPIETFTKPVAEDTPATEAPAAPAAETKTVEPAQH
jgi:hypothetical protein